MASTSPQRLDKRLLAITTPEHTSDRTARPVATLSFARGDHLQTTDIGCAALRGTAPKDLLEVRRAESACEASRAPQPMLKPRDAHLPTILVTSARRRRRSSSTSSTAAACGDTKPGPGVERAYTESVEARSRKDGEALVAPRMLALAVERSA